MKRIFSILQIMPSSEPMDWPMPAHFNWTLLTGEINKRAYTRQMAKKSKINLTQFLYSLAPPPRPPPITFFLAPFTSPSSHSVKNNSPGQKSLNDRLVKGSLTKNVGHWQLLEEKGLLISALNWYQVWRRADLQNVPGKAGKSEECE